MKPLKIALCGMDEQQASGFAKTFDSLRRRLGRTWIWGGDAYESADLVVIDIDTVYGHIDWLKITATGQRTVLYTVAEHANESDLILHKPLKTSELADVLVAVAAENGVDVTVGPPEAVPKPAPRATTAAAAPAVAHAGAAATQATASSPAKPAPPAAAKPAVASNASAAAAVKPAPAAESEPVVNSVSDWLLAQRGKQPVAIRVHDDEWIIDVERDTYHGPTTLKPLHVALKQLAGVLHPVDVEALERARKQPDQPLARLRWYAALSASPGILAPGLDSNAQYNLTRWPQIEREFPRHFRIATAMMKQADDIEDIASASGAPRDEVVDFINAYSVLGYIGAGNEDSDAARGAMSRFRNPFAR